MPFRIQSVADFWMKIVGDATGTIGAGDGSNTSNPLRFNHANEDIGLQADSAASSDTGTFSLLAFIKRLLNVKLALGQSTMSNSLRVAIASDQSALITVSRIPAQIAPSAYTRPADTTAYAAGDSLSNSTSAPTAITFANCVLTNGGGGRIERAICLTSQTTMAGAIRLHLYRGSAAPTATNDNAAITPTQTAYLGFVDFSGFRAGIAEGILSSGGAMTLTTDAGTTSLFALVEVLTAFTPASGQTFSFELWVDQI